MSCYQAHQRSGSQTPDQEVPRTHNNQLTFRALILQRLWIVILIIPSLYMLCKYPPLWKDIDGVNQLVAAPGDINVLHFPALYCFLARLPFWLTSGYSIFREQTPTITGTYLLVASQHVFLVGSLVYAIHIFARNCARTEWALSIYFATVSSLYSWAHCCGSESVSTSAAILVFAAGTAISLITKGRLAAWVLYTIGLVLAIGSKQLNVLLVIWLPSALLLVRAPWSVITQSFALGLVAVGINLSLTLWLCAAFRIPYHTTLGRTLSDRIETFLTKLPMEERLKIADQLVWRTDDSQTQKAIRYQASIGPYYSGMGVSDQAVLSSSLLYLKTLHPALLAAIGNDFWRGLSTNNRNIALSPFFSNRWGSRDALTHPQYWAALKGYPSLEPGRAESIWAKAKIDRYLRLWQHVALFLVAGLTIVLSLIKRDIQSFWLVGFGACVFLANMVCVYYSDRYALNLLMFLAAALAATIGYRRPQPSSKTKPA